jgi:GT2 family glycosyltransferase
LDTSRLFIVLVNWNLREDTLACIESFLIAGALPENIIVVDNGSIDGSIEAIRDTWEDAITLIAAGDNLGFAAGSNLGIQKALERGADWVFLINNDTLVAPDTIVELSNAVDSDEGYSILAPVIYYHDRPEIIWYLGDHLIPGTLITMQRYRGKKIPADLPALVPVDFVSGCGMLVERQVFEQIGLFDPSFVMYGEEVDFCWRARSAGHRFACATRARIWHKVSRSANKVKHTTHFLRIRNQVYFYRKYSRGLQIPLMFTFSLGKTLVSGINYIVKNQLDLVRPSIRGWLAGWFIP